MCVFVCCVCNPRADTEGEGEAKEQGGGYIEFHRHRRTGSDAGLHSTLADRAAGGAGAGMMSSWCQPGPPPLRGEVQGFEMSSSRKGSLSRRNV